MDQRLVVTLSYGAHLVGGVLLAVSYLAAGVTFTEGQREFLLFVGYLAPTVGLGLIWVKNYTLGAPIYVGATGATAWFTAYFFFVHDNPTTVWAVDGDVAAAYGFSALTLVFVSLFAAAVGSWLWYRESAGFRAVVDSLVRQASAGDR